MSTNPPSPNLRKVGGRVMLLCSLCDRTIRVVKKGEPALDMKAAYYCRKCKDGVRVMAMQRKQT